MVAAHPYQSFTYIVLMKQSISLRVDMSLQIHGRSSFIELGATTSEYDAPYQFFKSLCSTFGGRCVPSQKVNFRKGALLYPTYVATPNDLTQCCTQIVST